MPCSRGQQRAGLDFRAAGRIPEASLRIGLNSSKDRPFFFSARCHFKVHPGLKRTGLVFAALDRDFFSAGVALSHPPGFQPPSRQF